MAQRELTAIVQWVSTGVFGFMGFTLLDKPGLPGGLYDWVQMMFFSEAIGQAFLAASIYFYPTPKIRYLEPNLPGKIAWFCFMMCSVSRSMISLLCHIHESFEYRWVFAIAWGIIYTLPYLYTKNKLRAAGFHMLPSILSLIISFFFKYNITGATPFLLALIAQVLYLLVLFSGKYISFWIGEVINIGIWALFYSAVSDPIFKF